MSPIASPAAPMKRIHITGAPRSGTTLMQRLMAACFAIDGVMEREMRLYRGWGYEHRVFCTKRPGDEAYAAALLDADPDLHMIFMLRDPRDAACSRHKRAPDKYWSNLGAFKEAVAAARPVMDHPRFHVVRYEDLARDPDGVQARLAEALPFIRQTAPFTEFHRIVSDAQVEQKALGGVRPVSEASIGTWRAHLPRVKAQLALHGDISQDLIDLGYESDGSWLEALEGVSADNEASLRPETLTPAKLKRRAARRARHVRIYRLKRALGNLQRRLGLFLKS